MCTTVEMLYMYDQRSTFMTVVICDPCSGGVSERASVCLHFGIPVKSKKTVAVEKTLETLKVQVQLAYTPVNWFRFRLSFRVLKGQSNGISPVPAERKLNRLPGVEVYDILEILQRSSL